jgi:hypothetical protein
LAVDVGDGVKEVGREEGGGEVPVIDKGDGGDAAGTNRSNSAVFKFNRTKWGKFKETGSLSYKIENKSFKK